MKTAAELKAESEDMRRAFHVAWDASTLGFVDRMSEFMPPTALAYEAAWRAYKAGVMHERALHPSCESKRASGDF